MHVFNSHAGGQTDLTPPCARKVNLGLVVPKSFIILEIVIVVNCAEQSTIKRPSRNPELESPFRKVVPIHFQIRGHGETEGDIAQGAEDLVPSKTAVDDGRKPILRIQPEADADGVLRPLLALEQQFISVGTVGHQTVRDLRESHGAVDDGLRQLKIAFVVIFVQFQTHFPVDVVLLLARESFV